MAPLPASAVSAFLDRPDLRFVADEARLRIDSGSPLPFRVLSAREILISEALAGNLSRGQGVWRVRHALELAALLADEGADGGTVSPASTQGLRACFAAARTAALFRAFDGAEGEGKQREPDWPIVLAGPHAPSAATLAKIWPLLRGLLPSPLIHGEELVPEAFEDLAAWLERSWALIGPSETLMAAGGDARLQLDPRTGLNHYGCSHRPRPWAATFASSTASSVSERGFAAAEDARLTLQRALLRDRGQTVLADMARQVRTTLAHYYGLPDGDHVILAPSGTDCELAALAIAEMNPDALPVTNILIAPNETGRGVPLAAAGRHFADDTARLAHVPAGEAIKGFGRPGCAEVEDIPLRAPDGSEIAAAVLATRCAQQVERAIEAGRHVLLHQLDLSKTGLLAPTEDVLQRFALQFGRQCDIVVDACQARLVPQRVSGWVRAGRAVMVTGSKFFTGPPFCGALLLPDTWRKRLDDGALPIGLRAYAGRSEWPTCTASACLSDVVNHGLILRWTAALAEMEALKAVPPAETRWRLARFLTAVTEAIAEREDVLLLEAPVPDRPQIPDAWDDMVTILSFLVRAPGDDGAASFVPLGLAEARCLYRWLNADLRPVFTRDEPERQSAVAGLLCHIGQPVAVPSGALDGRLAGALRISAGARLVSGEPSHAALGTDVRLAQEISDARTVLEKISLIRRHWQRIARYDPLPTYAPATDAALVSRSVSQQNGEN
ncbi:hypothetical protein [Acetobacter conturbans]|uniref:Uncharacterized protein n=1 Tax=Acetobacter conturbans TaxID=1737472 RepID=A0ABX0K2L0_9PROT|nr:hypothetical protein [Acetobacter conturbans]NHN88475.1 hypothetical protein [Acetobacter conturbans]